MLVLMTAHKRERHARPTAHSLALAVLIAHLCQRRRAAEALPCAPARAPAPEGPVCLSACAVLCVAWRTARSCLHTHGCAHTSACASRFFGAFELIGLKFDSVRTTLRARARAHT